MPFTGDLAHIILATPASFIALVRHRSLKSLGMPLVVSTLQVHAGQGIEKLFDFLKS